MLTVWQVLPWHKCVFRIKCLVRVLKNIVPIFFIDKNQLLIKEKHYICSIYTHDEIPDGDDAG